ncbi:MAG: Nif3-like dinuclear metal center hexameric protein [Polyangiales bacterium]
MLLREITDTLERLAPVALAEPWDNVGLLVGDPSQEVRAAMLAIDATREVIDEACAAGCELILAYHPVIFDGLKRVTAGSPAWELVRRGIAVYSPHTALDVAEGGTNDVLAEVVGIAAPRPLRVTRPELGRGLGRVGDLDAIERGALLEVIREGLGVERLLVAGPEAGVVTRAAVGAGACGDLYRDALRAGAGLYLTGEMRHHDALRAASEGMTVVCALHSNSERVALTRLAARLSSELPAVRFTRSTRDRDPFTVR